MKNTSINDIETFYQIAQQLILTQNRPFTLESLLLPYQAKCGKEIRLFVARDILINTLNELLDRGLIKPDRSEEGLYYTIFIENKLEEIERAENELQL
ncbi:MAG: hypothetical protein IJY90_01050 [Clostridia bacterium]|nr:hypothetical protein [Clostridia bacterium]